MGIYVMIMLVDCDKQTISIFIIQFVGNCLSIKGKGALEEIAH